MVEGEVIPGVAAFAVVLTDRTPLPLAQVGSPFLPRDSRLARLVQALLFRDVDNLLLCHGLSSSGMSCLKKPMRPVTFTPLQSGQHQKLFTGLGAAACKGSWQKSRKPSASASRQTTPTDRYLSTERRSSSRSAPSPPHLAKTAGSSASDP